jgi:Ca-activated chloride channel family protein
MSTRTRAAAAAVGGAYLLLRARALLAAAVLGLSALMSPTGADAQTSDAAPKGGLFFKTSKPGYYYEAPLVDTDVALAVTGTVLRATVRQHFVNPSSAWLEGIYVFPLPEQAAVDHLVMEIGDRRVVGQIKERQEAKAVYEQAAANGQHASLVESERPNIFTTSVANIGPGEAITVEIQYGDRVHIDAGVYSLRFPMVVGPRYIPGGPIAQVSADPDRPAAAPGTGWAANTDRVPDASRITPPVVSPGQGKINPVRIAVDFAPGFTTERVTSLYHPITVTPAEDGSSRIALVDGDLPADRDFVLEWQAKPATAPTASLFAEQRGPDVYLFAMMTPAARAAAAATRVPRDVVFVVDTSGSMGGPSILQAKSALSLALDRLSTDDRFNVIQFNSVTDALFAAVQPWSADTLRQAQAYVAALVATGGTEMRPALRLALAGETPAGRLKQIVFLTDAAVGNEAEMFEDIAQQLGGQRLFTIGIGAAPNSYFMRKAAELGRGSFTYIGDVSEVGERMNELLRKLEEPALTDIAVRWPGALTGAEMYPATVPDLYEGQPVTFSARIPKATLAQLGGLLAIEGRDGDKVWRQELDLAHLRASAGVAAVWARAKLSAIEDQQFHGASGESVRLAAIKHALAYELVSQYTSLVAVDEEKVRPATERLGTAAVATNLPHGWAYDKVFGGDSAAGSQAAPLPEPGKLMREINFTGSPLDGLSLPKTATPAPLHLLIGALLLALAAASLGLGRRGRLTA